MQPGETTVEPPLPGTPVGDAIGDVLASYRAALEFPGVRVAVVVLFVALGAVVSTYAVRLLARPIARRFARESVAHVVLRGLRLALVLAFGFAGLSAAGLEIGNIVLSVSVFSAVVGIVLAPIVGSIISGAFVIADRPFEIGDMVELSDGTRGFVEDVTLRYTKIFTLENTFEVIPNSYIRDRKVTNLSAEDERTRLSLPVLVTYESDIQRARLLIERAAASCETVIEGGPDIRIGVARYPAKPTCYIDTFGDHGVQLTLRYWAKNPYKQLTVRSQVQTAVWDILHGEEEIDVEFAYPHSHLVFDDTSGVAEVAVREHVAGEGGPERRTHGSRDGRSADAADGAARGETGTGTGTETAVEGGGTTTRRGHDAEVDDVVPSGTDPGSGAARDETDDGNE